MRYPSNVGKNHYSEWIPEVSPSRELLGLWKSRKIVWKLFSQKYIQEMSTIPAAQKKIAELRELVKQGQTITLLCFESEWRHDCHRHILKELILNTGTQTKPDSHYNMSNAELISYIPKQKNIERQTILEADHKKISAQIPPHCYYCSLVDKFVTKEEYQRHVLIKHPRKLCYPGIADLKLLNIKAQGMPWEI